MPPTVSNSKAINFSALLAVSMAAVLALFLTNIGAVVAEVITSASSTPATESTGATSADNSNQGSAAKKSERSKLREEIEKLNQTIENKKNQIGDIEERIKGYNVKIKETQEKSATIQNEIELLENRLKKNELDIDQTQQEIDTANLEIRALDLEIKDKTERIADGKETVAEYLRLIYRYDDRSELEVLLANNSFSEFFDQIKYLEDVEHDLAKNLNSLMALKTELESERQKKDAKKTALAELQQKLDSTKLALDETKDAKVILVGESSQTEATLKRNLQELRNDQAAIDADLQNIERVLKDKLRKNDKFASLPEEVILSWPVDPGKGITTYFYDPDYPFRYVFEHPGIDIRAAQGTPVRAAAPGFVARARDGGMGYSYVMLVHSEGISTVYGHLSRIVVNEDEFIERGQIIAYSGGTPGTPGAGKLTTGAHLHFEVRANGIPVNPLDYLLR